MDPEVIRAQSARESGQWWFRGRADVVCGLLPPGDFSRTVLDIGCGWGGLTERLRPYGKVSGVEPSAAAREEAGRRGVAVLAGSAERLPVADGSVHLAVATDVIEHLEDDVAALSEIARVLRPDGQALITVPAYPWLFSSHDRALSHRRRYTRGTLTAALRRAGLEPARLTYFNTLLFAPQAAARLATRRRRPRVDAWPTRGPVNSLLYRVFAFEGRLLSRRDLPFGLSLAAVAAPARHVEEPVR